MRKSDMKKAYGKAPMSFHYAVMRSLNNLEEEKTVKNKSRVLRTVIACALVAAIGTAGVITARAVYYMNVNKDGNYGISFEMEPMSSVKETDDTTMLALEANSSAPEYVKMQIGYLPEGVTEDQGKYSLNGAHEEKCFTFVVERIAEKTNISDINIIDYEQLEINGNPAVLANVAVEPFSKRFYIYFKDYAAFVQCYVTDDVSDEEIKKVMENISFTEGTSDDSVGGALSEAKEPLTNKLYEEIANMVDAWNNSENTEVFAPVELGQKISYELTEDDEFYDELGYIDYSVDKIEVLDNIGDLDYSRFEQSVSLDEYADENGNLLPYTRETIKYGDGVNDINEVVATDTVNRRLIYTTVTFSNNSDTDKIYYLFRFGIERLRDNNGALTNQFDEPIPELLNMGEISYIDNNNIDTEGYNAGYYQITIPANSSETVHLGFWADEDVLDELYLELSNGDCPGAEFNPKTGKFVFDNSGNQDGTERSFACIKVQ